MKFMHFYRVNSVMSAFTLLEVIAGATFLVAVAVSVLLWIRKPAGGARLTVFDQLLDRVHARRTEIFARHRSPPGTIQAREELLAETRLRLRQEKSFFAERRPNVTAFTLIDLLMVIAVTAVCAGILLPALTRARPRAARLHCVNELKQIGLSFRIWANDHADQYPMHVSTNQGGTKQFVPAGNAFRHFQALSNELSTPKILVCPSDPTRTVAANFFTLSNSNLSYFVSLDAKEEYPQMFLAGDRFFGTGSPGSQNILLLMTNSPVSWSAKIHGTGLGNIALSDGSVQQLNASTLRQSLLTQGVITNRLAIP